MRRRRSGAAESPWRRRGGAAAQRRRRRDATATPRRRHGIAGALSVAKELPDQASSELFMITVTMEVRVRIISVIFSTAQVMITSVAILAQAIFCKAGLFQADLHLTSQVDMMMRPVHLLQCLLFLVMVDETWCHAYLLEPPSRNVLSHRSGQENCPHCSSSIR